MEGQAFFQKHLRHVIENLAASAAEQERYLRDLGLAPNVDELALELDDLVGRLPEAVEERVLTERAAETIRQLEAHLASFGGQQNAELWKVHALSTAPQWARVRELAHAALAELKAPRASSRS